MTIISTRHRQTSPRIRSLQITLLILVSIISYGVLVLPSLLNPAAVSLQVGDVSPNDYQAPQDIEYISEVRTDNARLAAENSVAPVYAAPDTAIARGQIDRLRGVLPDPAAQTGCVYGQLPRPQPAGDRDGLQLEAVAGQVVGIIFFACLWFYQHL